MAGLFFFDEDLRAETYSFDSFSPGNPQDGYAFQDQSSESWALFTSLDFHVSEDWDIKAGLRYSEDEKEFLGRAPRPDLPDTDGGSDRAQHRRRQRQLGSHCELPGERQYERLRPYRDELPCAQHPGSHPLLRGLRRRPGSRDELRVGGRRGGDHLLRGRCEDRAARQYAASQRHGLHLRGRRPAVGSGRRHVQHRDPAQRRHHRRLGPRIGHPVRAYLGLAHDLRCQLQQHRDRRSEPDGHALRRWLHRARSDRSQRRRSGRR